MEHTGEPLLGDFNGKWLYLRRPERGDPIFQSCQREAPNPIEETSHRQHGYGWREVPVVVL